MWTYFPIYNKATAWYLIDKKLFNKTLYWVELWEIWEKWPSSVWKNRRHLGSDLMPGGQKASGGLLGLIHEILDRYFMAQCTAFFSFPLTACLFLFVRGLKLEVLTCFYTYLNLTLLNKYNHGFEWQRTCLSFILGVNLCRFWFHVLRFVSWNTFGFVISHVIPSMWNTKIWDLLLPILIQ